MSDVHNDVVRVVRAYRAVLDGYGYDRAMADGVQWYPRAWAECCAISRDTGYSPARVAAVIAVTSPRARWSVNVRAARAILTDAAEIRDGARKRYRRKYGILPANVRKAQDIINADRYTARVTGPKVGPFYRNLRGDDMIVTVDTIMAKASGLGDTVTVRVRNAVTAAVLVLAQEYNLTPRDMQASIWVAYRGTPA